jgi:hypothetical protein
MEERKKKEGFHIPGGDFVALVKKETLIVVLEKLCFQPAANLVLTCSSPMHPPIEVLPPPPPPPPMTMPTGCPLLIPPPPLIIPAVRAVLHVATSAVEQDVPPDDDVVEVVDACRRWNSGALISSRERSPRRSDQRFGSKKNYFKNKFKKR